MFDIGKLQAKVIRSFSRASPKILRTSLSSLETLRAVGKQLGLFFSTILTRKIWPRENRWNLRKYLRSIISSSLMIGQCYTNNRDEVNDDVICMNLPVPRNLPRKSSTNGQNADSLKMAFFLIGLAKCYLCNIDKNGNKAKSQIFSHSQLNECKWTFLRFCGSISWVIVPPPLFSLIFSTCWRNTPEVWKKG